MLRSNSVSHHQHIRCLCVPLETWPYRLTECGSLHTIDRFDREFVGRSLELPSHSRGKCCAWKVALVLELLESRAFPKINVIATRFRSAVCCAPQVIGACGEPSTSLFIDRGSVDRSDVTSAVGVHGPVHDKTPTCPGGRGDDVEDRGGDVALSAVPDIAMCTSEPGGEVALPASPALLRVPRYTMFAWHVVHQLRNLAKASHDSHVACDLH